MKTRRDVLSEAVSMCMQELYSLAQPAIDWDSFVEENRLYLNLEKVWEKSDKKISHLDYCGPAPFNFYYLPKDVMKEVCDSYICAYKIDEKQDFLDTIDILKEYCKRPIVSKYVEGHIDEDGNRYPGYRDYDHPANLEKEIEKLLKELYPEDNRESIAPLFVNKFFEFLDKAGEFYNFNAELNSFNMTVYLGASPSSNKEAVIENWKKYKNTDIVIDDSKYEENEEN